MITADTKTLVFITSPDYPNIQFFISTLEQRDTDHN